MATIGQIKCNIYDNSRIFTILQGKIFALSILGKQFLRNLGGVQWI